MQIFVNTKYDFVKWRFAAVAFSLVWMLIGAAFYFRNGINWGIDFAGGANIVLRFKDNVPMDKLRADLSDASIQQYGKAEERSVLIRLPQLGREGDYAGQTAADSGVLNQRTYPGAFTLLNQETVGPQVGRELQMKAVWAVVLSTLAMGAYLWLRFDIMFGFAAIVCIVHDVLVSLAFLGM